MSPCDVRSPYELKSPYDVRAHTMKNPFKVKSPSSSIYIEDTAGEQR